MSYRNYFDVLAYKIYCEKVHVIEVNHADIFLSVALTEAQIKHYLPKGVEVADIVELAFNIELDQLYFESIRRVASSRF